MQIIELDPESEDVLALIEDIDALMHSLYPAESNQLLSIEELKGKDVHFIGIKKDNDVLGCGALVRKNNDGVYGELKRIYVKPECRGQGISRSIVSALIHYARQEVLPFIRLETGIKQMEAIYLYESLGFKKRREFGSYVHDPLSIYMELSIER
ncbi:GNAT family N-acetyltransferase [Veronia pacifica]|uniref:Acetyltransferase n=1 Tax=Veronia pacifica TaxID=1080227 RepID=A0A1C3EJ76_9GAMM|nr:GNAT family N-acetyltransferase [Veronia pacifica]ODA33297.1 acetyltransferase [Veronia pacifica]